MNTEADERGPAKRAAQKNPEPSRQPQGEPQTEEQDDQLELVEVSHQHPLPWILLVLSWLGFAAALVCG